MRLERNKGRALTRLEAAGEAGLALTDGVNHGLWLGVGFAVAKGWAVYLGDDTYRITPAGQEELAELRRLDLLRALALGGRRAR